MLSKLKRLHHQSRFNNSERAKSSMIDQPNLYSQPEEISGVPVGEAKTHANQRGIGFWLAMGCIGPLALIGLYAIALVIYVVFFDGLDGWGV